MSTAAIAPPRPARRAGLLLVALLAALPLAAQENMGRGRVKGEVRDEAGQPLAGVALSIESLQGTTRLEDKTDAKGRFTVAGLGTGSWRVVARKEGYAEAAQVVEVKQLGSNPPVTLTLKKLVGVAGFLQDESARKAFDEANAFMKDGTYDQAIALFEELLVKHPDMYQVRLNIGTCQAKSGRDDKAETEFQAVLDEIRKVHGDLAKDARTAGLALAGLGEIDLRRQDFEAARVHLSQALEVSPQDEGVAYNVGEIYFSNQQADEAVRYFELAAKIKPDWAKPHFRLGVVMLNKGDYAKALEHLRRCVEMDPQGPDGAQAKAMIEAIEKIKK